MKTKRSPQKPANPWVPEHASLNQLADAALDCKACDLWKRGTQTVFGEGRAHAKVMFIGEQPGNQEDLKGKPLRGTVREKLLDTTLAEAGIDRGKVYVDQCGEAFQMGASRETPHPQKTGNSAECSCVQAVARCGDRSCAAQSDRLSWRHGGSGAAWTRLSRNAAPGRVSKIAARASLDGYGAPFFDFTCAG